MENEKKKIFVSYTQKDRAWALWIAEQFENQGHEAIIMDWDFRPGDNFVGKMDEALRTSQMVIAVLSRAYLKSYYCESELTAAYIKKNLIPVRVDNFVVDGLWATINYIDLVDKTEKEASKLLDRIFNPPERKSEGFPGKKADELKQPDSTSDKKTADDKPERISSGNRMPINNLPEWNKRFTGREEILTDIRATFQTKSKVSLVQAQAITGMGGIGKTEIAKEYAYRNRDDYDYIWWVIAETDASIEEAYRSFSQRIRLGTPEDKSETVITNVRNWMNENRRWLFIFDNAKDEKSLERYSPAALPESRHILVTSRFQRFRKYTPIEIKVFKKEEACAFIQTYTQKPADSFFEELAKRMGYLPLALDQAGAYMYVNKISYEEYLSLYKRYNLELLAEEYDNDPQKKTVATTWKISLDEIKNPASKQLLNLCAFFAPDNISVQWFQDAADLLPADLREVAAHDLKYKKTLADLTKYALVSLNEGFLSIHRLVQEVIRDNLKDEQSKWRTICVKILNELRYFDFSTVESRSLFLILIPHIESVTQEISHEEATEEVANLYFFLGRGCYEFADYALSLKWYEKVFAIRKKVLGETHPSTATTYNNIGEVYRAQGTYDLALEYNRKALAIYEKVLGEAHPSTATYYNNIAAAYDNQGNYNLALEYYRKATTIREKVLGEAHPDTAITYNNIAVVYCAQGNYDLSLEYYQKALAIREKLLGETHPDTANTYNNIAAVYNAQANYDLALRYYQKALAICEKVLGEAHPFTANTYNNIGEVYRAHGNYILSLEYYRKALVIREKVLGEAHPDTATTYNNIAAVYYNQGNYDLSLEYYRKALNIREKVLGKAHPGTATTYNNIAEVYRKQGHNDIALEYNLKALAIREKVLGKEHPDTATTYNNIALVYYALDNYDLALEYYRKALATYEKVLGETHPSTVITYNNIAAVYDDQGNYDLSLQYYRKALAIQEKVLGVANPSTTTTYNNIAFVYHALDNYDLSLDYFRKTLAIREKVLGEAHPDTATTYNNIAAVYDHQGNYDLALEWYLKSYPVLVKVLGLKHQNTKTVFNNMADAYEKTGKPEPFYTWLRKNSPKQF